MTEAVEAGSTNSESHCSGLLWQALIAALRSVAADTAPQKPQSTAGAFPSCVAVCVTSSSSLARDS